MSCKNTQEFLAQNEILDGTVQSAGKEPVEGEDALQLLEGISDLYIAKGKKILHFDIEAERPSDSELLALLLLLSSVYDTITPPLVNEHL